MQQLPLQPQHQAQSREWPVQEQGVPQVMTPQYQQIMQCILNMQQPPVTVAQLQGCVAPSQLASIVTLQLAQQQLAQQQLAQQLAQQQLAQQQLVQQQLAQQQLAQQLQQLQSSQSQAAQPQHAQLQCAHQQLGRQQLAQEQLPQQQGSEEQVAMGVQKKVLKLSKGATHPRALQAVLTWHVQWQLLPFGQISLSRSQTAGT